MFWVGLLAIWSVSALSVSDGEVLELSDLSDSLLASDNVTVAGNTVNTTVTPKEQTESLGPRIVGGDQGTLGFESSALAQAGEAALNNPVQRLGEGNETAAEQPAPEDKSNAGLFDLVPLFQGIQADRERQRALVGRCAVRVNELVSSSACAENKTDASGACKEYKMPPMSDAMQALWKNAQSLFCKYAGCEASLCYKYPGPVGDDGLPVAAYESFKNQAIWIEHNQTTVEGKSVDSDLKIVQQYVSFDIELEKMVFCEKLAPSAAPSKVTQVRNCYTSRRCKMKKLVRGHCVDGASPANPPATIACPVDEDYMDKLKLQETELTAILCAQA